MYADDAFLIFNTYFFYSIVMPIYEYKCTECEEDFEELVSGSDPVVSCPKCGSKKAKKKLSLFGMSGVEKPVASAGGSGCSSCSKSTCSSCH